MARILAALVAASLLVPTASLCQDSGTNCNSSFCDSYGFSTLATCLASCQMCSPPNGNSHYAAQRSVLERFFESTAGADWTYKRFWLDLEVSFCAWQGVKCDSPTDRNITRLEMPQNNLFGTVTGQLAQLTRLYALNLASNSLSGSIPPSLTSLKGLDTLDLHNNVLSGVIPEKCPEMRNLYNLILSQNSLSGTLPTWLPNLSILSQLDLSHNSLSGAVPSELSSLHRSLGDLDLNTNLFSGSIPSSWGSLTKLYWLRLLYNHLSGTIPSSIAKLTFLTDTSVAYNRLSGTVPVQIYSSLVNLEWLGMEFNRISGTIPSELTSLTNLYGLFMYQNRLSGYIPRNLFKLNQLPSIGFGTNQLSGTIPADVGNLTQIYNLDFSTNKISGAIPPQISRLVDLSNLGLYANLFSGTIPSALSALTQMNTLLLHQNSLSGTIPPILGTFTDLQQLGLAQNLLSGSIPSDISLLTNLVDCVLQSNKLTGTFPSLVTLGLLENLALFSNQIRGHVELNTSLVANSIFLFNNRLSCRVSANYASTTVNVSNSLVLPGNAIQGELPDWFPMKEVYFLYTRESWWEEYSTLVAEIAAGIVLLVAIAAVLGIRPHKYVRFSPRGQVVGLQLKTAQLLGAWSVPTVGILVPIYIAGANRYECGKLEFYATIAYLIDSAAAEWAAAAGACAFAFITTALVLLIRAESSSLVAKADPSRYSLLQWLVIVAAWAAVVVLFSTPMVVYTVSTSLPGGSNTLGIGLYILEISQQLAGATLALTNSFAIPYLAKILVKAVNQGPDRRTVLRLILTGRLMVTVVVPLAMVLVLHQDCFAKWLLFWEPCQREDSFEVSVLFNGNQQTIVSHNDVCKPSFKDDRCPRAVVEVMGTLIVNKLIFSLFVVPPLVLLTCSSKAQRLQTWLGQTFFRDPQYEASEIRSVDQEMSGIVMLTEYPIIFGFAVPCVIPLCGLVLAHSACAFNFASESMGLAFDNEDRPSSIYMCGAAVLGYAQAVWFFHGCGLHGLWLVIFGMPVASALSYALHPFYIRFWQQMTGGERFSKSLPGLLVSEDEKVREHSETSATLIERPYVLLGDDFGETVL